MGAECVFCQLINGENPAATVLDSPDVMGFLDVRPLFPGHVLIVPKKHHTDLMGLPAELVNPVFEAVRETSLAVQRAMESDGIFVASNNGVSQSVAHLHVHVVPRKKKDGLRGFMWPRVRYSSDEDMHATAALIRKQLG